ncbi:MAG: YceI family protein, partial [Kutzneria sp.]|nr:YceI family protein [Kutzneria sp.]
MTATTQPFIGTFVADQAHSSFQFEVVHMLVSSYRASFEDVTASVVVDEHGARLEGRVKVDSISIRTPAAFREHVINGKDFFDGANHPEITFRSEDVRLAEDNTLSGKGQLTIKGITKP